VLAAKQLLEALETLHSGGFVHGGEFSPTRSSFDCMLIYIEDLNDNNVMWGMIPLDDYDTAAKYKRLGRPQKVALQSQKSGELVRPARISASLLTDKIYLGDFGLATGSDIQGMEGWQPPMQYCAPEVCHNFKSSFASDMWSYMCIFAQLYFGGSIFSGLSSIVNTVGPMPKEWKGLLQASKESWYDQSRKIDFKGKIEYRLDCFAVNADAIERSHVVSIMIKGFRYLPQERMTATQLLRDPSFQALIKIYS
jgi:serine/threonine protein kinase